MMTWNRKDRTVSSTAFAGAGLRVALAAAVLAAGVGLAVAATDEAGGFQSAASSAEQDLQRSLQELSDVREKITAEKLPLTRELRQAESRLIELRDEFQKLGRDLDKQSLEMNQLQENVETRKAQKSYLANLLDEYIRNFESRLHVSELQRYQDLLREARLASESADATPSQVFGKQVRLLDASADRLLDLVGGAKFEGRGVGQGGDFRDVEFTLVGPLALYRASDGSAGLAEQRLGSLEAQLIPFTDPDQVAGVRAIVDHGDGTVPFDPSLGNARKIEATQDSLVDHIEKGGPVMVPILLLAAVALIVAVAKWVQISRVPTPSARKVSAMLEAVKSGNHVEAVKQVKALRGPIGRMLEAGVQHVSEPKELVEEVMYERMLETRLRLQSLLPFVAMTASAAPLLGLLGTVTGMIDTFKLITVFGSGDARTLSSGISEALITTQFGLIVAIPSLLLYAYLSRKARRITDGMEKTAVSFLNRIPSAGEWDAETVVRARPAGAKGSLVGAGIAPPTPQWVSPRAEGTDH